MHARTHARTHTHTHTQSYQLAQYFCLPKQWCGKATVTGARGQTKKTYATHQAFVIVREFVDDFIDDTVGYVGCYSQVEFTEKTDIFFFNNMQVGLTEWSRLRTEKLWV